MTKARVRVAIGWVLFVSSVIGCPLSIWWTDEPPFILALSWLALTLTSWDIINTAELHDRKAKGADGDRLEGADYGSAVR